MGSRFEEYIELQANYPRGIGNDFLLPSDLETRLGNGNMSFFADETALFLFERREGFRKLVFRIKGTQARLPPHCGILASFLTYREGNHPGLAADWLQTQGFSYRKTLRRHTAVRLAGELSCEGISRATADETYGLFFDCFGVVEADLPCREEYQEESSFCLRSTDGKLLGISYDMGRTHIIATSRDSRRQGVGRRLYMGYAASRLRKNPAQIFHDWIDPENTASLALFRSMGFAPDDIITECFVRGD